MTVVHHYPPFPEYRCPCCFRMPRELEGDEFTNEPGQVTCDVLGRAAGDIPPLREPEEVPEPPANQWRPVAALVPFTESQARRVLTLIRCAYASGVDEEPDDEVFVEHLREVG